MEQELLNGICTRRLQCNNDFRSHTGGEMTLESGGIQNYIDETESEYKEFFGSRSSVY
jgi:hypothetical protein